MVPDRPALQADPPLGEQIGELTVMGRKVEADELKLALAQDGGQRLDEGSAASRRTRRPAAWGHRDARSSPAPE